jgi:hypothetical protein
MLAAPAAWADVLSYAAKFACGTLSADGNGVKGVYATAINIQNPNSSTVKFENKAVTVTPDKVSGKDNVSLRHDRALSVDCADIRALFTPDAAGYIEGFLLIEVDLADQPGIVPLNVIGKYTARQNASQVQTMDIQVYQPTTIK